MKKGKYLSLLTGDGNENAGVGDYKDEKRDHDHSDQAEDDVQLLLPLLRVVTVSNALVERLVERSALHREDNQLKQGYTYSDGFLQLVGFS